MTISEITPTLPPVNMTPSPSGGLGSLDQGDFLRLMTVQMQNQDPFDPVDQNQMLAQMAQFSSLAGTSEMGETLKSIAAKLDALTASQTAFLETLSESNDPEPAGEAQAPDPLPATDLPPATIQE